jgi:murein endopeptidase
MQVSKIERPTTSERVSVPRASATAAADGSSSKISHLNIACIKIRYRNQDSSSGALEKILVKPSLIQHLCKNVGADVKWERRVCAIEMILL